MKYKILIFGMLLQFTTSCYSPKQDIEEDKFPDVPEFPKFEDDKIVLEKVVEINSSDKSSFSFKIENDLFVMNKDCGQNEDYSNINEIYFFRNGKKLTSDSWTTFEEMNFIDDNKNIFYDNKRFEAPSYKTVTTIEVIDYKQIEKKYENQFHLGENEKDTLITKKQNSEKLVFQKSILNQIKTIEFVDNALTSLKIPLPEYEARNIDFICNANSAKPFIINGGFLMKINPKPADTLSDLDLELYEKLKSKIIAIPYSKSFVWEGDDAFSKNKMFKEFDNAVVDNAWYSTGNHMVGSFGYHSVLLNYYDVNFKSIATKTKVNHKIQSVSNPFETLDGFYFKSVNYKSNKVTIWFLRK